jgi:hypothetical protein
MDEVTRTITYEGPAARASALVQMLEQEGCRVEWERPTEYRYWIGSDLNEVAVNVVSTGTLAAIGLAVHKFRKWAPRVKVKVEGEGPDDGGFMPDTPAGEDHD